MVQQLNMAQDSTYSGRTIERARHAQVSANVRFPALFNGNLPGNKPSPCNSPSRTQVAAASESHFTQSAHLMLRTRHPFPLSGENQWCHASDGRTHVTRPSGSSITARPKHPGTCGAHRPAPGISANRSVPTAQSV